MAIDTIKSTAVLDGAIATADIADDAVTADKLANSINTSIAAKATTTALGTTNTAVALKSPIASPVFTGNVGIGVTPETDWHSSIDALQIGAGASIYGDTTATGNQISSNARATAGSSLNGYKYIATDHASTYQQYGGQHNFRVAPSGTADAAISWNTAVVIDNSGNVLMGGMTSLSSTKGFSFQNNSTYGQLNLKKTVSDTVVAVNFYHNNSVVGSIKYSNTATQYVTSSDYRLKENVTPMSGATAQTKLLKPCNFDWIQDGSNVNGFLAHELAEVVPEAVTGTKDAMMDEEYEVTPATDTEAAVMGTRSVPDLQGIDQSKLVPLLVKTIQELEARITALEDA